MQKFEISTEFLFALIEQATGCNSFKIRHGKTERAMSLKEVADFLKDIVFDQADLPYVTHDQYKKDFKDIQHLKLLHAIVTDAAKQYKVYTKKKGRRSPVVKK